MPIRTPLAWSTSIAALLLATWVEPAIAEDARIGRLVVLEAGTTIWRDATDRQVLSSPVVGEVRDVDGGRLRVRLTTRGPDAWACEQDAFLYDEAVAFQTERIQARPDDASAYVQRGILHALRNEFALALADYDQALRLNPADVDALLMRAYLCVELKKEFEAIADLDRAEKLAPDRSAVYYYRGFVHNRLGEAARAIEDLNRAIRLTPDDADCYLERGRARGDLGDHAGAAADFGEALRIAPGYALAHHSRGVARIWLNDFDAALADFDQALRHATSDPSETLHLEVLCRFAAGRPEVAADARGALDAIGWDDWDGRVPLDVALLGSLAARRAKDDAAARAFLDEARAKGDPTLWPFPVVDFLRGDRTAEALRDAAPDTRDRADAECWIALDAFLSGRTDEARASLRRIQAEAPVRLFNHAVRPELERLSAAAP